MFNDWVAFYFLIKQMERMANIHVWGRHLTKETLKRTMDLFGGHIHQPLEESLATGKGCDFFRTWLMEDGCSFELFHWEDFVFLWLNKFSCIMKHLSKQSWRTEYHEIIKVSPASLTQPARRYGRELTVLLNL